MMKDTIILLIEDNKQILDGNKYFLERSGYTVDVALTLSQAKEQMDRRMPSLIILDIMLPDGNGLDFLKELRQSSNIPVLLLTSLGGASDIVDGLTSGGDDYLPKPYDFNIFLARVKALLRRSKDKIPDIVQRGALKLDVLSGKAFLEEEDLLLTPKQFALLLLLLRNEGEVLSPEYLYETVWKQPITGDSNALWKQMSHLYTKLADKRGIELTLFRGKGYCLEISEK
ncbi:MAG: response regulator transcription factor [Muricomes sp.]